jgi:hypothetical protein
MSCRTFEGAVAALSRGRPAPDSHTRDAALAHARECGRCARRLEEEQRLSRALDRLAAATADREASPAVEARLLEAFRDRAAALRAPKRAGWRWATAAAGLAAAGVVGLVLGPARREPAPPAAGRTEVASAPAAEPAGASAPRDPSTPAPPASAKGTPEPAASARPAASPHARRVSSAPRRADGGRPREREAPDPNRYVPWLWADPTTEFDRGHVVRVGVPRAALASWGWPLEGDVADEAVEAELLLGEDGVARAIRVVR